MYNCQKTVDELGDKISGEEKAKATAEIENVKKALEGSDIDKIKEATEKLKQAFYAMSEKLYGQEIFFFRIAYQRITFYFSM